MTYKIIAEYPEYDVLENITYDHEYSNIRSEERSKRRKEERKTIRDSYIMAAIMTLTPLFFILLWLLGYYKKKMMEWNI